MKKMITLSRVIAPFKKTNNQTKVFEASLLPLASILLPTNVKARTKAIGIKMLI
jgi:hypothetical protein